MRRLYTSIFVIGLLSFGLNGQEYRSVDGSGNNQSYDDWGSANTQLLRMVPAVYLDGISAPSGDLRPNPRYISNSLFSQYDLVNDKLQLSDYVWVFGQFIDHDITAVVDNPSETFHISVPPFDPHFDPFGSGNAIIPMFRSAYDPSTGTDTDNPRQHVNSITAFIDGSGIYGSDEYRASWLRAFHGGLLKTSKNDLLPFNTVTGEFNDPIDPNAPHMDNPVHPGSKVFVAGDARANENLLLISFHTLFLREHNRLCENLKVDNPSWNDEQLYQEARRINSGFIQSIVFNEWLPAMGIYLREYNGYNSEVNPGIYNVFSAAAYRLGHTLINSTLMRLDESGNEIDRKHISLRDAFFNPHEILLGGGIEPLIKGMGTQVQQDLDCKIIDDVRNFLFGPPGAGGLDLASINIQRGRERGIGDLNKIRSNIGLTPYASFSEIHSDAEIGFSLEEVFGDINEIDPWVGMLAEEHMSGALVGPTIMKILQIQFENLRDGDRFYYLADPDLSDEWKKAISQTKLSEIIKRNTGISLMQENVFEAMPHLEIPTANIQVLARHLEAVLYPNPFLEGPLNVRCHSIKDCEGVYKIISQTGRIIAEGNLSFKKGINQFNIEIPYSIPEGLYSLYLETGTQYKTHKFIRIR